MLSYVQTMYNYMKFALTTVDESNMTDVYRQSVSTTQAAASGLLETVEGLNQQIAAMSKKISELSQRITALEGGTE